MPLRYQEAESQIHVRWDNEETMINLSPRILSLITSSSKK